MTDNGGLLFWQVLGSLAEWNIIINEARSLNWEVFKMSIPDFLLGILQQKLICHSFPSTFPDINPSFEKYYMFYSITQWRFIGFLYRI